MAKEKKLSGSALPCYHQIRQHVFAMVNAAPPTVDQIPLTTEKELCEFFGVSRGTVRKALQMLTDEGILVRRPHYGTFISPKIMHETVHLPVIGVILGNGELMFWDEHLQEILAGIFEITGPQGCLVRIIPFLGSPEQTLEAELRNNLAGIIWAWGPEHLAPLAEMILRHNIPLVNAVPLSPSNPGIRVLLDYEDYGYELTRRLLAAGYPDILFMDPNTNAFAERKKSGIIRAFTEAGRQWHDNAYLCGSVTEVWERADRMLATGKYRVVNSSGVFLGYEKKHEEVKFIIPKSNIANCPSEEPFPSLAIPAREFGKTAAELLFRLIRHPEEKVAQDTVIKALFK